MLKKYSRNQLSGSVFSFGSGVQSTAIILLIKYESAKFLESVGHLPDIAIFADTGAEKASSLKNLEYWRKNSPIPLYRVKNWKRNALNSNKDIPVFFKGGGAMQRQCTFEWKIKPLDLAIRKLYPKKSIKKPVAKWLGLSCDEITRIKESRTKSIKHIYPLIELGLNRQDCYAILDKYGIKATKSSCWMCPYQKKSWYRNPEIDKAIAYEKKMQANYTYREKPYLHPFAIPLGEVIAKQQAQLNLFGFDEECDGYCGL